jgi:ERCC4-type nuclease
MIKIDDREVVQHPDLPERLQLPSSVERLRAADLAFLDRDMGTVGVERSEIGNFVQKLRDGELESQMYKCQEEYNSIILLLEGVYDNVGGLLAIHKPGNRGYFRNKVYSNTFYHHIMAAEIRLSEMGIEVIHSPNYDCTVDIIRTLYHQRTKPEEQHSLFKRTRAINLPVKLTANPAVPRLMALVPRLSEKVAIRLMNEYGTIWDILHKEDKELLRIEGMGKGLIQKIKEGVGKPDEKDFVYITGTQVVGLEPLDNGG